MPTPVSDAPVTEKVGDVWDVVRSDDEDPRSADASRVKTPLSGLVASTTKVYPVDGTLTLPLASVALIVTEWLPSARSTDGATENAPDIPDDDADPMAVVPSYIVTKAPASTAPAGPTNVGRRSEVVGDPDTVTDCAASSAGADGWAGGWASVSENVDVATEFPAKATCRTPIETGSDESREVETGVTCVSVPDVSAANEMGEVPPTDTSRLPG